MSNTVKLSDIAADLGYEAKDIVAKALELDISVKNATSKVSVEDAGAIYDYITSGQIPKLILDRRSSKKAETKPKKDENKEINCVPADVRNDFRNDEQRFVYDQSTGCRNNRRNRG